MSATPVRVPHAPSLGLPPELEDIFEKTRRCLYHPDRVGWSSMRGLCPPQWEHWCSLDSDYEINAMYYLLSMAIESSEISSWIKARVTRKNFSSTVYSSPNESGVYIFSEDRGLERHWVDVLLEVRTLLDDAASGWESKPDYSGQGSRVFVKSTPSPLKEKGKIGFIQRQLLIGNLAVVAGCHPGKYPYSWRDEDFPVTLDHENSFLLREEDGALQQIYPIHARPSDRQCFTRVFRGPKEATVE